jgi:ribosomal protein S18 acetylase RimI-like enzyme
MICRSFAMTDYDAVVALWRSAGLEIGISDTREAIAHRLERDPDLFVVGEEGGAVVAAVLGCYDGRRGWVNRLAVRDDLRNRALGAQLLAELERRFRIVGCVKVNLLIEPDNAGVEAFYRKQGYATDPLIFMEKRL